MSCLFTLHVTTTPQFLIISRTNPLLSMLTFLKILLNASLHENIYLLFKYAHAN